MTRVIGVRFRNVGKIYYFSPQEFDIYAGDHVIVETARGIEYGTVVLAPRDVEDDKVVQPLKDVLRVATPEDDEQEASNRSKEKEAFEICFEKIRNHGLEMKLIDVEYTFDKNKVLFYFTADGRIDFRELVKDLAAIFKTRIELRQIGVRDETKILGGIGICGRPLCCHTYLSEFAPVSIKMAKEQNLSLNPTKISGTCGRLMCCLKNEQETYEYLNSRLPAVGDLATTPTGLKGEVQSVNVLRQLVKVLVQVDKDEVDLQEYKVDDLVFQFKGRREKGKKEEENLVETIPEDVAEGIAELEMLEEKEQAESQAAENPIEKKHNDRKSSDRKHQEKKHFDKKPYDKKQYDKKPYDKKPYDKKPYDKNALDKNALENSTLENNALENSTLENNALENNTLENNTLENNTSERKTFEKKPYEKKTYDKKSYEKKSYEKKPYEKKTYEKKTYEKKTYDKSNDKTLDKERRYKKFKDRGRDKQHDSNVTSE